MAQLFSDDEGGPQLDLTGVTFHKRDQKWQARVKRKKVHHHIGYVLRRIRHNCHKLAWRGGHSTTVTATTAALFATLFGRVRCTRAS